MESLKSTHGHDRTRVKAPGNTARSRRMRKPVEGGRPAVLDAVRAVTSAEGAGNPLRRRAGGEECAALALHGHRPKASRLGPCGVAPCGRSGPGRCPPGARARRTVACCSAVPQLL